MKENKIIGFIGLSHLSLSYSLASAKRGYQIIMYDFNNDLMNKFKKLDLDFNEKSLLQKFKKYRKFYNLNNKIENLSKCSLIFISQDVETNKNNIANYSKIKKYINHLDKNLKKKFHSLYKVNYSLVFVTTLD